MREEDFVAVSTLSHVHHEVYLSFFRYCALAGLAKIRTDWLLDGADAAARTHARIATDLMAAQAQFVKPMRKFEPAALMYVPSVVLPGLKRTTAAITEDLNRVHSYGLWCQRHGISFQGWGEIGSDTEDAPLLLVRAG